MTDTSISAALLYGAWSISPLIAILLVVTALLFARGWWRLRSRTRPARRRTLEALAFAAGWSTLVVALLSPLHELGESLLAAHMAQHELLMVVAAPLLILARPVPVLLWGMPPAWRRGLGWLDRNPMKDGWRWLTGLGIATGLHAAAILVWHLPLLYQAGLRSDTIHALQHGSFLATALLFWYAMFHGAAARHARGAAILCITLTSVYTGTLGMLLTFARSPLYPVYLDRTSAWGVTPLDDQRLAGLIMWIPGSLGYLLATLVLTAYWLGTAGTGRRSAVPSIPGAPLPSVH